MKKRKAQLKIQEMAFMLMAVVIFFILAGLFLVVIKYREMYQVAGVFEKEKALSTISKITDTAEFSCGKPSCVDTDKLVIMQERESYSGFWQVDSLSVRKVFSKQEREIVCNKNNYPDCNLFKIYDKQVESEERISTYVSLCRKEQTDEGYWYEKCEMGMIIAGLEVKQPE